MKIPVYTNEQLLDRMWAKETVIQVMNRHNLYCTNAQYQEALEKLWVTAPEYQDKVSMGYNRGYYVGMDNIRKHFVDDHLTLRREALKAYCAQAPQVSDSDDNLGYGCAEYHTSASPLVVIADDGMSAKYLGYHYGYVCSGRPDGTAEVYMTIGLIFADLLLEGDEWRILHMASLRDHSIEPGKDYSKQSSRREVSPDPLDGEAPDPTIKYDVYKALFGWEYLYDDMPKPYKTYDPEDSYGPEGKLGKPYYERERRVF